MFTGIIEGMGKVISLNPENGNLNITLECAFSDSLKIDQSVSHNGVCLTVVEVTGIKYRVTAISETLRKSNLGLLKVDELINLERSMVMNGRIDGHIVQGHIDATGVCTHVEDQNGSWMYHFEYDDESSVTVEKGSVCVNGVSLTVVNSGTNNFSVAIIPYTLEHTNFKNIKKDAVVNLEFDVIGKYVAKILSSR